MPHKDPEKRKEYMQAWKARQRLLDRDRHKRYYAKTKEQRAAKAKIYYAKNRDKFKERNRRQGLKGRFGITLEDYVAMLESQSGRCAICGSSDPRSYRGVFCVDHCHKSGQIRGLLCVPCNVGLGQFLDNTQHLTNAIEYLNKHGAD